MRPFADIEPLTPEEEAEQDITRAAAMARYSARETDHPYGREYPLVVEIEWPPCVEALSTLRRRQDRVIRECLTREGM